MKQAKPSAEESNLTGASLRRRQLRERLRSERTEAAEPSPAKQARIALIEQRRTQVRDEVRAAEDDIVAALVHATENRALEIKVERRATLRVKDIELAAPESDAEATESVRLRADANALKEEQQRAKEVSEEKARHEQQEHTAVLRKKEQRQQAADMKAAEEELALARQHKAQERKKAAKQASTTQNKPESSPQDSELIEPEPPTPKKKRARQQREEDVPGAEAARQARNEMQQQLSSEREILEQATTNRHQARRELKRQTAERTRLEFQTTERIVPDAKRPPRQANSEAAGPEAPAQPIVKPSAVPRVMATQGSMARSVTAAPSRAADTPAQTSLSPQSLLQTQAGFIVDENGDALTLRGVTVTGLDTVAPQAGQTLADALSLGKASLATLTDQWGANLVRLPFAANTILSGNASLATDDLLAGLDQLIGDTVNAGAYVLLTLQASPGATPADVGTAEVWETLAARYRTEPRVLYEAFCPSGTMSANSVDQFVTLIALIREQDPASLIFVPGSLSGLDVSGAPLRDEGGNPVANLVYTIGVQGQSILNPDLLAAVSSRFPVFASVWSDDGSDLGRQASRVADLFERFGIGWAAGNWNGDSALVANAANGDFSPTIWGDVVLRAIKLTTPPLLEPAAANASLSMLRAESSIPPQLATSGNFILNSSKNAVALRGVNVVGIDTAAPAASETLPDAMSLDQSNLALITGTWGLNLVRLPFQAQTVLAGNGSLSAASILAGLDLAVSLISAAGSYILLAVEAPLGATMPDASTQEAWQTLAKRYKDQPSVLYEIFASPGALAAGWQQAALSLIGTIRQYDSAAMIFVNTGTNGTDFSALPLTFPTGTPIFNLVYTINASAENTSGKDDAPLATFADNNPVFVSLWSDDAQDPSRLAPYLGDFFARHNIGWAAANWNADPALVTDAASHDLSATGWGLIVGRAATLPVQPYLKPF